MTFRETGVVQPGLRALPHVERIDVALAAHEPLCFRVALPGHASSALVRRCAMGGPGKHAAAVGGNDASAGNVTARASQQDFANRWAGDVAPSISEVAEPAVGEHDEREQPKEREDTWESAVTLDQLAASTDHEPTVGGYALRVVHRCATGCVTLVTPLGQMPQTDRAGPGAAQPSRNASPRTSILTRSASRPSIGHPTPGGPAHARPSNSRQRTRDARR
jgi:hypothetical protein